MTLRIRQGNCYQERIDHLENIMNEHNMQTQIQTQEK